MIVVSLTAGDFGSVIYVVKIYVSGDMFFLNEKCKLYAGICFVLFKHCLNHSARSWAAQRMCCIIKNNTITIIQ
jgi:hypothetical protein